jgi:hypothetical protein
VSPPAQVTRIGYVDELGGLDQATTQGNILLARFDSAEAVLQALLKGEIGEYVIVPAKRPTSSASVSPLSSRGASSPAARPAT